jgi:hypothetical protein
MKGIIDRFEGELAIVELEDRKHINVMRKVIPPEAKEGDVLLKVKDRYIIDKVETERRKAEIEALSQNLWE